jgi:hypothetical protein
MFLVPRRSLERFASLTLPGLVHFAGDPLVLDVDRRIRSVRVYLPGLARLYLQEVSFPEIQPADAVETAIATISPSSRSTSPAFLKAGRIRTSRQNHPYWQIDFSGSAHVSDIEIRNRLLTRGIQGYGVCVEVTARNGEVLTFDNLSPQVILNRLNEFHSQISQYLEFIGSLTGPASAVLSSAANRIRSDAAELLAKVRAALDMSNGVPAPSEEERKQLLLSVLEINAKVPKENLKTAIILAKPVLDSLIYRGPRNGMESVPQELEALGTVFCARIIERGRMSRAYVQECQTLITSQDCADRVEKLVNRLYDETGEDKAMLPIMFRKHGMGGPRLQLNSAAYIASMKEIEQIFAEFGYQVAICYGTLLGAVRERAFIPHDDDVDMAVLLKTNDVDAELEKIREHLAERFVQSGYAGGRHKFLKVHAPKGGRASDVFPIVPTDERTVQMYMEGLRIRDVPRHLVDPFTRIQFYGEAFYSPADAPGFLANRYGPTWMTPQRPIGRQWFELANSSNPDGGESSAEDLDDADDDEDFDESARDPDADQRPAR